MRAAPLPGDPGLDEIWYNYGGDAPKDVDNGRRVEGGNFGLRSRDSNGGPPSEIKENTVGVEQKIIEESISMQRHRRRNTLRMKPFVAIMNQVLVQSMIRPFEIISVLNVSNENEWCDRRGTASAPEAQTKNVGAQFPAQNSEGIRRLIADIQGSLAPMDGSQNILKVRIYGIYTLFIVDISTIGDRYPEEGKTADGPESEKTVATWQMFYGQQQVCQEQQQRTWKLQNQNPDIYNAYGSERAQRGEDTATKHVKQAKRERPNTYLVRDKHQDQLQHPLNNQGWGGQLRKLGYGLEKARGKTGDLRFGLKSKPPERPRKAESRRQKRQIQKT
ncbi:hypothetical protein GGX14DRAFT_673310, partial [Mycena pura]